jgi:hypothetical protein
MRLTWSSVMFALAAYPAPAWPRVSSLGVPVSRDRRCAAVKSPAGFSSDSSNSDKFQCVAAAPLLSGIRLASLFGPSWVTLDQRSGPELPGKHAGKLFVREARNFA